MSSLVKVPDRKGKLWKAFKEGGCFKIYDNNDKHCGNITESKDGDVDGWIILGFACSPYKGFSDAARRCLGFDLSCIVKYHPIVQECPSCKKNHFLGEY